MACTTTVESVEAPTVETASSGRSLSTPTEALLPALELGQNVELAIVEPVTEAESSDHSFVAPEPHSCHSFVEPLNERPELPNGAVRTAATVLALPVTSDLTVNVQAPLSSDQESKAPTIELRAALEMADKIVAEHAMNGSAEQVLKTPETFEQSTSFILGANTLGVLGANESTVPESLPVIPLAEPMVETAPLAVEQGAVTPATPLPEPPPPVDRVQELATFAELLLHT
ncbi:hypothetical protein [Stenomitos frigidus]|uniref:Uncharacterized protein n=1 Tax=Stenomitos frigidus ULC18 TaxID=2107698 RepID=A0A2T1DX92_9CYAN|nr:hypothetical protein [Stenomitos frigidus]PSB24994.1 hypothetical protein C7B82_24860 [Stenomitos frigidus ULC18]